MPYTNTKELHSTSYTHSTLSKCAMLLANLIFYIFIFSVPSIFTIYCIFLYIVRSSPTIRIIKNYITINTYISFFVNNPT